MDKSHKPNSEERARQFAAGTHVIVRERLGLGTDGIILATGGNAATAIKGFDREKGYFMERDVYLRLQEHGVRSIQGHAIPQLLAFDDQLWVIEMSIVRPPFVLDFAKCDLDWPTEFSDEVVAEELRKNEEVFEHHWPKVQSIMAEFESKYGIFLRDVHPGNIKFE